jgi:hypothetical protein
LLINDWIVQNPSFAGYAATMAYLQSRKLAIAASVTLNDGAALEGNLSADVLQKVAAYLVPECRCSFFQINKRSRPAIERIRFQ